MYKKINKDDVYEVLISCSLDFMNPIGGVINIVNIADLLKTSRYQVKKYIDELRAEGLVELRCVTIPDEYECCPPYWGYGLTEKAEQTEHYKGLKEQELERLKKCFAI